MTGVAWFNEVFFENVRVPRTHVVGEIDRGWDIAITTLSHERAGTIPYQRLRQQLSALGELAGRVGGDVPAVVDDRVRQRLAQHAIEIEALRLSTYRSATRTVRTGKPGPEGSMLKLVWSELEQRLMETASLIEGAYGLLDEHAPQAYDGGRWRYGVLWSRAASIYAGTSEVQRNIIAQRVLGLPRG
jgi:alkylation response protein AidB-like acyl-CoA dehydrogenase